MSALDVGSDFETDALTHFVETIQGTLESDALLGGIVHDDDPPAGVFADDGPGVGVVGIDAGSIRIKQGSVVKVRDEEFESKGHTLSCTTAYEREV